jgi:excisionase family DNA binding protein
LFDHFSPQAAVSPADPHLDSGLPLRWQTAPDLLTPAEVITLLRSSRSAIYESLRYGPLSTIAIRWGRKYLIPKAALRRLIESEDV